MNKYKYLLIITLIIILIANYKRIYEILDRAYKFINLTNYSLIEKTHYDYDSEKLRNISIKKKTLFNIPNNIFQIYINQDEIPCEIIDNINFIKDKNPDWKYYLITDKNINTWLTEINDEKFVKIYNDISDSYPAAKSDLLRYILMKYYGGVYLDIKSRCTSPLNDIIEPKIMLFKWCVIYTSILNICSGPRRTRKYLNELVQWVLIYPKGHFFIDTVLNNIEKKYNEYKKNKNLQQDIFDFTGPDVYTDSIMPLINDKNSILYPSFVDKDFVYTILRYSHKCYSKSKHYSKLKGKIIN